jgi:hypothetical protein
LRTFYTFQRKIATLSRDVPGQRALCRLLSSLVDGYIAAFDEEPLPVALADRAINACSTWSRASIFEPARRTGWPTSIVLQRTTSGIDCVIPQQAGRRGQPSGAMPRATKTHHAPSLAGAEIS